MHRTVQGWQGWRRLTAYLLIYALFIHGIVFAVSSGLAATRLPADAASTADQTTFELCRHDSSSPREPGDPVGPAADTHCAFCVAGPGFVLEPPTVSTVFCPVALSIASWPLAAWRVVAPATVDASARPRGPPTAA
jgi:hypothetical protein